MSIERPDDIVRLATAENPAQAHIWEKTLQAEGIRCMVVGDYLDASFGDIPGLKPELWVLRQDRLRAEAIINEKSAVLVEDSASVGMDWEDDDFEAEPARPPSPRRMQGRVR